VTKRYRAKPKAPRQAGPLRTRRINLDVSEAEWVTIAARAKAVRTALRAFIREAALRRATSAVAVLPPTASEIEAASTLACVAGDLTRIADAAEAGTVTGIAPNVLRQLADTAQLLGMRFLGVVPRAA
jgi:hypothetical protein